MKLFGGGWKRQIRMAKYFSHDNYVEVKEGKNWSTLENLLMFSNTQHRILRIVYYSVCTDYREVFTESKKILCSIRSELLRKKLNKLSKRFWSILYPLCLLSYNLCLLFVVFSSKLLITIDQDISGKRSTIKYESILIEQLFRFLLRQKLN